MAGLGRRFNAEEHDTEQRDYENLPDGIYKLEVSKSDVKPSSSGKGTRLSLVFDVVEPEEFKGRKIFGGINVEHADPQTQEIGQKELASLCRACSVTDIEDSEELHFIPFMAKVGLGKPSKDGKYPAKNEIKRYYFPDADDVPEAKAEPRQATPAPANDNRATARPANDNRAAPAAGSRPWGKRA